MSGTSPGLAHPLRKMASWLWWCCFAKSSSFFGGRPHQKLWGRWIKMPPSPWSSRTHAVTPYDTVPLARINGSQVSLSSDLPLRPEASMLSETRLKVRCESMTRITTVIAPSKKLLSCQNPRFTRTFLSSLDLVGGKEYAGNNAKNPWNLRNSYSICIDR